MGEFVKLNSTIHISTAEIVINGYSLFGDFRSSRNLVTHAHIEIGNRVPVLQYKIVFVYVFPPKYKNSKSGAVRLT